MPRMDEPWNLNVTGWGWLFLIVVFVLPFILYFYF